jgi:predicted  nucleic acid-binding Zn-ribbon protein
MAKQWPHQWFLDARMHLVETIKAAMSDVQTELRKQQSRLEAFMAEEGLLEEPHEVKERQQGIAQCKSEIEALQRQFEGVGYGLEQEKRVVRDLLQRRDEWLEQQKGS